MINVVFFGSSAFGLPSIERLAGDRRFQIVGVVSQPDRPTGRMKILTPTPASVLAQARSGPLLRPESLRSEAAQQAIMNLQPDLFLVAAYGLILPAELLAAVGRKAINIHASLLPKYRGASPIAAAIFDGAKETGVSLMAMSPRLDDGPTIGKWAVPITPTTTAPRLTEQLAEVAAQHINETLVSYMADQLPMTPQPEDEATYSPKLTRESGRATWVDAQQEERRIRAYDPWPGCWTTWRGKRLRLLAVTTKPETLPGQPGTIVQGDGAWGILCQAGVLVPSLVQRDGGKPQPAATLQSLPDLIGSVLGT